MHTKSQKWNWGKQSPIIKVVKIIFKIIPGKINIWVWLKSKFCRICLLYTSDAADERSSVDLGGRRIIKKKNIGGNGVLCDIHNIKNNNIQKDEEQEKM